MVFNTFHCIKISLVLFAALLANTASGQILSLEDNELNHKLIHRYTTLYGDTNQLFSDLRYFDKRKLVKDLFIFESQVSSDIEKFDLNFLKNEFSDAIYLAYTHQDTSISKRKFWSQFYTNSHHLYENKSEDFYIRINPIINFSIGNDVYSSGAIFQNTRGLKISGILDKKVSFYTEILENQRGFANYIQRSIGEYLAIPGQGFYRQYNSGVIKAAKGLDYLNARAHIGFNVSKSIQLKFGHGQHFTGNGMRSLLLSDFGHNYLYLNINTQIGIFNYQNVFAELASQSHLDLPGNSVIPKKYLAVHYLSLKIGSKFSLGFFESVVYARENGFEFQYLNPVILYRSVENQIDSPDNVMLGVNYSYKISPKFFAYGQVVIDELSSSKLISGDGWWGNKTGMQIGFQTFNLFQIDQLDLRMEYNAVRPFTYSHNVRTKSGVLANYSHYNQALAHPLGANFRELVTQLNYRPAIDWNIRTTLMLASYGENSVGENVGANILNDYSNRLTDYGHFIGQGIHSNVFLLNTHVSWSFRPNHFIDLSYTHRKQSSDNSKRDMLTGFWSFGVRVNYLEKDLLF